MRLRNGWWAGVALALLVTGCSDGGGSSAAGEPDGAAPVSLVGEPEGPTLGELVAGTSQILDGTWVWTDYVYDDHGANTDEGDRTAIDDAGGDATYPDGLENSADIVQVQLRPLEDSTQITVVLETLVEPSVPYVSVDIAMGADAPAHLSMAESPQGSLDTEIDVERNTMTAEIPLSEVPRDEAWNLGVATGIKLAGSSDATPPNRFDLAFVVDEPYQWQDYRQADILGGKAAREDAEATIDWDDVEADSPPDARSPGFHTYLYRSQYDLGEGIEPAEQGLQYLGPYQPYLVYLPEEAVDPDRALTVFLHGLEQNHIGSVNTGGVYLGTARPLSEELHELQQFARDGLDFAPHNMTVWPLARGEGLSYEGIAERDVLDVLDDAARRLDPDPDRIILEGASMGGVGAFRLGALHPDRFSVAVPVIGFADELVQPLLTNFEHLPLRQINGAQDPLIAPAEARGTTDVLDALELGFVSWMLDQRGHEAGGYVYDCVYASLPSFTRVKDPARVRYSVSPELDAAVPRSPVDLDLHHDGAYWVSGMASIGDAVATIDVTSEALARRATVAPRHVDEPGASVAPGADLCGPNPDVLTGDTWRERAVIRDESADADLGNRITGTLTALGAATLDVDRAGLELSPTTPSST